MTRAEQRRLAVVAVPATAYVVLMALIAALWVKPPLLGWIGFAIVALVGAALIAAAYVLLPRSRTNTPSLDGPRRRDYVVVLADAACSSSHVAGAIARHLDGRGAEVHVVAPMLPDRLHFVTDDEESDRRAAERRLTATLEELRGAGIAATASIATDDPQVALDDAVAGFPAGEIVIVTSSHSQWLEEGLLDHARQLAPEVEEIVAAPVAP
jgi:hypothetical protein